MKKIFRFILSTSLFLSFVSNAAIICPASISCNYDQGTCNLPTGWYLDDSAAHEFFNENPISLTDIWGKKLDKQMYNDGVDTNQTPFKIVCTYWYEKKNEGLISASGMVIYAYVKELEGSQWSFHGFGKKYADCPYIYSPDLCPGK